MDWIKVKVKHAEYDFGSAPGEVFKAWIMMMIYVAATERKPLRKDLCNRIGEKNVINLENWVKQIGISTDLIIDKILEDVEHINSRKAHERRYMQQYRGKVLCKDLRKPLRNGKEKRREEKKLAPLSEEAFIASLKDNSAYKHIDIDRELSRMDAWLIAHPGRKKVKRFILNWLNKIEIPLEVKPKTIERGDAWKHEEPR